MAKINKQNNIKLYKKRLLSIVLGVSVIAFSSLIVYAYLTSSSEVVNKVQIGNNTIEIIEEFTPPKKQTINTIFKKKVQVKNTGNVPCYIRVYADFSDGEIRDISFFSNYESTSETTLDETSFLDENYISEIANGIKGSNPYGFYSAKRDVTDDSNYVNLSHLPTNWVFIPDNETGDDSALKGYYYYTKEVAPGDVTSPLFTYIMTIYKDEQNIKQFDVIVYGESVQVTDKNGDTFEDDTDENGIKAWKKAWREFLDLTD